MTNAMANPVATMDFEQARFNMVEQQIRPWDVLDPEVLGLMMSVKREDFVPAAYREVALADVEIPLSAGAKMWPPRVEARILQELQLRKSDRVLEVGTGSGFLAALLGRLAADVVSVEIDRGLAESAKKTLQRNDVSNVTVEVGDGAKGWAAKAPYDVIVVTGAVPAIPAELLAQLKVGGRLAAVVGVSPLMNAQVVTQTAEGVFSTVNLFETVADPLKNVKVAPVFEF
jgi:protein-L-isoaspartate(D-aspartate) O-methyltransferase